MGQLSAWHAGLSQFRLESGYPSRSVSRPQWNPSPAYLGLHKHVYAPGPEAAIFRQIHY